MSTTSEHLSNCQREVKRTLLLRKYYHDARRVEVCGRMEWSHSDALANATGFTVEVVDKPLPSGGRTVTFLPYHELRDGDDYDAAVVRVYAADWYSRVSEYDFLDRIKARPEVHGAILAMLKARR
jgi:hypothetical protein